VVADGFEGTVGSVVAAWLRVGDEALAVGDVLAVAGWEPGLGSGSGVGAALGIGGGSGGDARE
jgi:hypothetical protein